MCWKELEGVWQPPPPPFDCCVCIFHFAPAALPPPHSWPLPLLPPLNASAAMTRLPSLSSTTPVKCRRPLSVPHHHRHLDLIVASVPLHHLVDIALCHPHHLKHPHPPPPSQAVLIFHQSRLTIVHCHRQMPLPAITSCRRSHQDPSLTPLTCYHLASIHHHVHQMGLNAVTALECFRPTADGGRWLQAVAGGSI